MGGCFKYMLATIIMLCALLTVPHLVLIVGFIALVIWAFNVMTGNNKK